VSTAFFISVNLFFRRPVFAAFDRFVYPLHAAAFPPTGSLLKADYFSKTIPIQKPKWR
jgi:hypothetical protein